MKITFLGQAGVLLESAGDRVVIDPYLSDNLSMLSKGFWARSAPIPLSLRALAGAAAVVCTHEHPDHLDPVTVAALLTASKGTVLVAPEAALLQLPWRADPGQLRGMRGEGEVISAGPFTIRSLAAAHTADYRCERTEEHGHRWCSVVVEAEGVRVFHAGDTVDYAGYAAAVGPVDVACVPINGRGREGQGIVGNMDELEAADLCRRLPAGHALALHWDMFAVNPGDPVKFASALGRSQVVVHTGSAMSSFVVSAGEAGTGGARGPGSPPPRVWE